jgi:NACHT domain
LAGTGKSTVARTVARKYFERKRLGASFFFSRGGGDVSHAGKFFTSIAVQLANNAPCLQRYICDAIRDHGDIASQSLRDQWCQLLFRPLSKLDGNSSPSSFILVIDALDECDDDSNVQMILQLLAEAWSLKTVRLRVFMTSRPEIPIRHGFYQIPQAGRNYFILHDVSPEIVDNDISVLLVHDLRLIAHELSMGADWPGEQVVRRLVQKACGLFIWAAIACRFIRAGPFAERRLHTLLEGSTIAFTPKMHLGEIYSTVLKTSVRPSYMEQEKQWLYSMLREILGTIVVLFSPLSAGALSRLLPVTQQDLDQTLKDLHAILDIPKDQTRPLRLHHPSFRDFLLNTDICGDQNFRVDKKQAHRTLTASCIRLMSTSLRQDICGMGAPSVLVTDIESSQVEHCLSSEVQYACLYWVQHLQKGGAQLYDNCHVHEFLQVYLLHWLETLSWMRKISEGILAITSLVSIALVSLFVTYHAIFN